MQLENTSSPELPWLLFISAIEPDKIPGMNSRRASFMTLTLPPEKKNP